MANQTYINARCKALENRLLTTKKLHQIIDSSDTDSAIKLLNETKFFESKVENIFEIENHLEQKKQQFFDLLKSFSLEDDVKEFFMLPIDFFNAEVLLLSKKQQNEKIEDLATCNGLVTVEYLKHCIKTQVYQGLPQKLSKVLERIEKEDIAESDISNVFKTELYQSLKVKDKYFQKIIDTKIDLINIETAFRAKNFDEFEKQRIKAGTLDDKFFSDLLKFDKKIMIKYKNHYLYKEVEHILDNMESKDYLTDIENKIASVPLKVLDSNKYDSTGKLPFMFYAFRLYANIDNLRIIFVSLANGLDKQETKRRLRWNYEG
ncbi:MAG: V-type ATPase subunit [Clostridia bacterium]|nr:V-type ATPase subunit [Clostridia bacterium]